MADDTKQGGGIVYRLGWVLFSTGSVSRSLWRQGCFLWCAICSYTSELVFLLMVSTH